MIRRSRLMLNGIALGMGICLSSLPVQAALPLAIDSQQMPSLAPILETVTPAVVNISVSGKKVTRQAIPEPFRFFFGPNMPDEQMQEQPFQALGSGVIIDATKGYVITNYHVIQEADEIKVTLKDGREFTAKKIGEDQQSDIALLQILKPSNLTQIAIADSDKLRVGDFAVAVGNPLGTLSNTVTDGIVSALNRQVTVQNNDMTLIQTDASISPGNSGGGLFNANGELIGIVNAKSSYSEAEGIGFAIPINTAMEIGRQLIENGSVARPALGVKIMDVTDAQTAQQLGVSTMGVYVVEVTKGSGADAAGVQAGDRVLAVDDTAVSDSSALKNYLKDKGIGDTVNLQVERDGKVLTLAVTLGSSAQ
mgnify:CR=1 FL=1